MTGNAGIGRGGLLFVGITLIADSIYGIVTNLRVTVLASKVVPVPSLEIEDVTLTLRKPVGDLQTNSNISAPAIGVTVGGRLEQGEIVVDSPFMHWRGTPTMALLVTQINDIFRDPTVNLDQFVSAGWTWLLGNGLAVVASSAALWFLLKWRSRVPSLISVPQGNSHLDAPRERAGSECHFQIPMMCAVPERISVKTGHGVHH